MSDHELHEPTMYPNGGPDPFSDRAGALEDPVLAELDAYREAYRILRVLDPGAQSRAVSWLASALPNTTPAHNPGF